MLSKSSSITHEHILTIINTECANFQNNKVIRILDAGCGSGKLISYLTHNLPILKPTMQFEIFGYDVRDHGVQSKSYIDNTLEYLSNHNPDVDWEDRITVISGNDPWPYSDEYFDIIVSNQVLEHVYDHDFFFLQLQRTLRIDGFSIHLFPLKNCYYDGHLNLPFVHKIKTYDFLYKYIKFLSALRLGKYIEHKKTSGVDLNTYTERHADYIWFFTNYIEYNDLLNLTKKYQLRASFKYTWEFYRRKIKSIMRMKNDYSYSKKRSLFIDFVLFKILVRISSITLFLEKKETYTK